MNAATFHDELEEARAARRRAGESRLGAFVEVIDELRSPGAGPLAGLPYAAKDLFDTPGRAPTLGLTKAPNAPPTETAPVLAVLDGAGAVRIGFTEMTPLAYEPSGDNPLRHRPENPWRADIVCGGSSSGSAVAVAAGLVPLALGSDTGGSVRIPAQACGVCAWRPGSGIVPSDGAMVLAESLDAIGFLARDAAVLERVAALFCRQGRAIERVRLAEDVLATCEPDIAASIRRAASAIHELGLKVAREPGAAAVIAECDRTALTLLQAEAAINLAPFIALGQVDPIFGKRVAKGAEIAPDALAKARQDAARLRRTMLSPLFGDAEALLLPVMPIRTPTVAECEPGSTGFSARMLYALSALTRFVNVLDLPVVAVPVGLDSRGMPVAAQLLGPPGSDRALIALAGRLASALPPLPSPAGKASP